MLSTHQDFAHQPRFVKPSVYFVGYQSINYPELERYLIDSGNTDFINSIDEAKKAGLTDAEILCSVYSKLCYRALTIGKNNNVSRVRDIKDNFVGTIGQAHGSVFEHINFNFIIADCSRVLCYHPDTEILTSRGWRRVDSITTSDRILTMDQASKLARWSIPKSVRCFNYEGDLLWWENSQGESPKVTRDHLLWAVPYDLRQFRGKSCKEIAKYAQKRPAAELWGKRFVIDHEIRVQNAVTPETIDIGNYRYDTKSLFAWLGWLATDGGFSRSRPNQCNLMQAKKEYWPQIESLMNKLFNDRWRSFGPYEPDGLRTFRICDGCLASWARQMIGPSKEERAFSPVLFGYGRRLLLELLNTAISGDGNRHPKNKHEVIYCANRSSAGHWQLLVSLCGMVALVREDGRLDSHELPQGTTITKTKSSFVVSISRKCAGLVKRSQQRSEKYRGHVWCPETEDGLVYVRTPNGLPMWSGNTHELVRHRIGVAFSQTSGRYCRLDRIPLVLDPILEPVRDLWEEHLQRTDNLIYLSECDLGLRKPPPKYPNVTPYAVLTAYTTCQTAQDVEYCESLRWVPDNSLPFAKRKQITSALRRAAPNGQANEIGFSVNMRALRHTILMRTARVAEWEIRLVFGEIYRKVKSAYPLVFCDASERIVDGLVEVYGMTMQPYEKSAEMVLDKMSNEELDLYMKTRPVCREND